MSDSSSNGSSCSTNAGSSGERIHCFGFSDISSTQQEAASATSGRRVTGLRGLRVREDGRQEGHELVLHLVGRVVDVQEDRRRVQAIDRHLLVLGRSHRLHQRVVAHAVHRGRVYVTNRRETYPDQR